MRYLRGVIDILDHVVPWEVPHKETIVLGFCFVLFSLKITFFFFLMKSKCFS